MPANKPRKRREAWSSPRPTALLAALLLAGCGASQPVVYPSIYGPETSSAQIKADVAECKRMASEYGADSGKARKVAKDTATGAAVGGAATGVYGAVRGYEDAGERALAGAAAGAAVGLIRGVSRTSEPSSTYRTFVNRCLSERGYDVVGWD